MRPVMRRPPLCTLKELQNGTYSLNDLADMHEAMDEEDEYRRRWDKKAEADRKT